MTIRSVLFDWGGTIVRDDTLVMAIPCASVAYYARQTLHLALRDEVFERAFESALPPYTPGATTNATNINTVLVDTFAALGWTVDGVHIARCAQLFFDEATQDVHDDARALLASLKYRGFRTGVVTNSIFPGELFTPRLAELGIAGYVDAFVSSADAGRSKPDPRPYEVALERIGVSAQEAHFVGDRVDTDIAGARAAGLRAVLIDRRGRRREGAGYLVVSHLGGLNDILGEGNVH
jgi:HAD superfamily hydrolase (TIGR01509 family)